jgi:predicted naringenin-chalcone synthase
VQNLTSPAILSLGTAVPPYAASQAEIYEWMATSFAEHPSVVRWLRSLYTYSGIEKRYACIPDFLHPVQESRFAPGGPLQEIATTARRMAIYERESAPLAVQAVEGALDEVAVATGATRQSVIDSITHLVTISCTGFFAPGLDLALVSKLGLPSTVGRTMIGFMGCSAMFNGLRTAHQIVCSDPTARVLIVSVELCSLHVQPGVARENLISASLFADGASACVVGMPEPGQGRIFVLDQLHTEVKPETGEEMVWQIGDYGFELKLSPRIPRHLGEVAPQILAQLFPDQPPEFCAIHPGGPAILDELESILALDEATMQASRAVLRNYGNISSATILFVLDELRQTLDRPQSGVAMAFGPGLTIEMVRLSYQPEAQHTSESIPFPRQLPRNVDLRL